MTTPTTLPVALQAIEARSIEEQRLKARVGVWVSHPSFYPLSKRTVGQLQEDAAALLSLLREKDQVIERLEKTVETTMQAVRELRHAHDVGPEWYTNGQQGMWAQIKLWTSKATDAFNATHSGEKTK